MGIETAKPRRAKEAPQEEQSIKEWSAENFAVLMGNLELLKNTTTLKEDPETYMARAYETYDELDQYLRDYGGEYHEDVNEVYRQYSASKPLVVRRENPNRIVDLVHGNDVTITFDPEVVGGRGDKYANCALWPHGSIEKTNGIANAFLEGRGNAGPIVMVAGYDQNAEHMSIEEPAEKMEEVGTISRQNVKILSGTIKPEDLEFIILRSPVKFFDKNRLTPAEQERLARGQLTQVFRGYTFDKKKNGENLS
ncbi:MAG TPA: hypothetical protein PLK06_04055 [bacterium]|nr:hypothetical protein [bacterium]